MYRAFDRGVNASILALRRGHACTPQQFYVGEKKALINRTLPLILIAGLLLLAGAIAAARADETCLALQDFADSNGMEIDIGCLD